ncbi:serine hydrolase domain-containing protein [Herbidospora mongoliensis]|uniref:serine hydrolase domain-containing protein n=1 Tax=Herbidospora mongoliensis TaxID=688067 RepID=UPI000A0124AE|nr:serine hydrolase domain-containing protein [Herbidospora mongoliensis]
MLDRLLAAAVPEVASAAVALIAVDGVPVAVASAGELVRYADASGTLASERPPVREDSVFDLASLTKLFTTVVALSLVETGLLALDEPVATWLPSYYGARPSITVRHLLTHTAGLPPGRRPHGVPPGEGRWDFVLSAESTAPPGAAYVYSDVGMITLGRECEIASGSTLDSLVRRIITGPLGLGDTSFRPPATFLPRIAATEFKPERGAPGEVSDETASTVGRACGETTLTSDRGRVGRGEALAETGPTSERGAGTQGEARVVTALTSELGAVVGGETTLTSGLPGVVVRGEVHDETAHSLGGVAGHAGLFSSAGDLMRFAEILRAGGAGVLSAESVAEMMRDQRVPGASFRQGLGFRIGDPAIVGPLADAYGHSGFTGTSLVVDVARGLTVVLLTNNVHPVRGRAGIRELRNGVAAFGHSLLSS